MCVCVWKGGEWEVAEEEACTMHAPTSQRSALTYARGSWYADESIKAELLTIVNTNFGSGKLVLIGGVQINMPSQLIGGVQVKCEDHFMPLMVRGTK